jgi:hypothetical protein
MTSVVAPGVGSMRRLSRRGFSNGAIEAMIPAAVAACQFPVASFRQPAQP